MNYHNPTRQRGIWGKNYLNAKSQSLADASGCDEINNLSAAGVFQCSMQKALVATVSPLAKFTPLAHNPNGVLQQGPVPGVRRKAATPGFVVEPVPG